MSTGDVQACELKLAERERLLREMRLGDLLRATGYAGDTLQALQALRDLQRERQVLVRVLQACDLVLSTLDGESDAEQQSLEQLRCSIAQATLADRPQEAALLGIRLGLGQQAEHSASRPGSPCFYPPPPTPPAPPRELGNYARVPMQPTPGMVNAGLDAMNSGNAPEDDVATVWAAMLRAAPRPTGGAL